MRKQTQYYITYERDENGGYIASAPSIAGCAVYGKTLKKAFDNICAAVEECLEVRREFKKSLPKETVRLEAIKKSSFAKVVEEEMRL